MVKSASVNIFKTIWICYMPTDKRKKGNLHRAGKAPGQTKLIEVCYSLRCCNELLCNVYQALLTLIYII